MKAKLALTIISIFISFTSPTHHPVLTASVTEKKSIKDTPLAVVRELPIVANKSQIPPTPPPATPPAAVAVPTSVTSVTGCSGYLPLIQQYNWPVNTMVAICEAESGGNPYAYNPSGCYGLFQINGYGAVYNPAQNIADAYQKYLSQGLNAWTTYSDGAYLQYLDN